MNLSMKDKICLVTGGSSGVGKATAAGLARLGATVIIASRNEDKANAVIREINTTTENKNIHWMYVDLASQVSIRNFVATFTRNYDRLNVLSNNAGLIQLGRKETVDGIEMTLAVDFLSHFLISNLLTDHLKKGAPSRIITVAGGKRVIQNSRIYFDDIQLKKRYNGIKAALQAALARVIFSIELAKRLEGTGITSNSFHPGLIKTGMVNNQPAVLRFMANLIMPFLKEECKTSVYLASSEEVENVTGKIFKKNKPVNIKFNPALGNELWRISETLTGLK